MYDSERSPPLTDLHTVPGDRESFLDPGSCCDVLSPLVQEVPDPDLTGMVRGHDGQGFRHYEPGLRPGQTQKGLSLPRTTNHGPNSFNLSQVREDGPYPHRGSLSVHRVTSLGSRLHPDVGTPSPYEGYVSDPSGCDRKYQRWSLQTC